MSKTDKAINIGHDHARAGTTPGVVRRVLALGLLAAILAMSAAWIIPALWG